MTQSAKKKKNLDDLRSNLSEPGADKTGPDDGVDEAQEEAYRDVGRFPDRDQLFGSDHHRLPSKPARQPWERWSGDMEPQVKGDRDSGKDAVEELHDAQNIVDEGSEDESLGDLPTGKTVPPRISVPRAQDEPDENKNAG